MNKQFVETLANALAPTFEDIARRIVALEKRLAAVEGNTGRKAHDDWLLNRLTAIEEQIDVTAARLDALERRSHGDKYLATYAHRSQ